MFRFLSTLVFASLTVAVAPAAPTLRESYLASARAELVSKTPPNPIVWKWLDAHPDVRTGLLIADSPANPDHLLNLTDLLQAVTPQQADRYANLLLVVSLQSRFPAPKPPAAPATPDPVVAALAKAMKDKNLTLVQVISQIDPLAKELKLTLPKNRNSLWDPLAVASGTYPASSRQTPVNWVKGLISRYETKLPADLKGPSWPLFPMDKAPWPLLLPMRQMYSEEQIAFFWDRFNGKIPGARLKLYVRYTFDYEKPEVKYKPSLFPPGSLPRIYEDGGVCGRISTLAQGTLVMLAQPAMGMYQPGHRALLSYEFDKKNPHWYANMQQSVSGAEGTSNQWFLPSSRPALRAGANPLIVGVEYHIGLALAMNKGLDPWVDGRIGLASARKETNPAEKIRLLRASALRSPYDAEIWYAWADLIRSQPAEVNKLLQDLDEQAAIGAVVLEKAKERSTSTDFNKVKEEKVSPAMQKEAAQFVRLVSHFIFTTTYEKAFANVPDRAKNLALIKAEIERRNALKTPYGSDDRELLLRYRVAAGGLGPVRQELDPSYDQALADAKQRAKLLGSLLPKLQAAAIAASGKEKIAWLESLRTRFPAAVRYTKNAKGVVTDPTYAWVCAELAKTLKSGDPDAKSRAKQLDEELKQEKTAAGA